MKIQLYNPPVYHYSGVHYRMNPALGLPILAAVLEKAGHKVQVWDLEALAVSPDKLAQSFAEQRDQWPDAVGFTCTTHNQRGVRECIEALRGVGYDRYINIGGPHITMLAQTENIDETLWGVDAWVVGECEGNVSRIFRKRLKGIVQGEPAPIEDIPAPLWTHHMPSITSYQGNEPRLDQPESIAMWARGCPHHCIFCGNPVFQHQPIRMAPPENVYRDMKALADMGVKTVFVYDDELVGLNQKQNEWLLECCRLIEPLGLTWKCQGRCSERAIQPDVLKAMCDAGCRAIMWGVETFSDRVLKAMKKATIEADIWHTLEASHDAGIGNWIFLMVGNYKETQADLRYTEAQMAHAVGKGLVQWRQVTVCTPVPGTELHRLAEAEGWLVEQPESGPQMGQVYAPTAWLSQRELRYWRMRLLRAGV